MKFAIFLQHYFPYGGLQRDALRLAEACHQQGHEAHLIISTCTNEPSECGQSITTIKLNAGGHSNHAKAKRFAQAATKWCQENHYHATIAFSRVPGANFYFAGDPCYLEKFTLTKPTLARFLPRYASLLNTEHSLFSPTSTTHIFFLAKQEIPPYLKHYQLSENRYTLLPPWIKPPKRFKESTQQLKAALLAKYNIPNCEHILLFVGSDYHRKGLDLAIKAVSQLNKNIHLVVCGKDKPEAMQRLASKLNCIDRVHLLGASDEIPEWMSVAKLLIHPARQETAGMVLLEALSHGLPVLCSSACGYAEHIKNSASGFTFSQREAECSLHKKIQLALEDPQHNSMKEHAVAFYDKQAKFDSAQHMIEAMCAHGKNKPS